MKRTGTGRVLATLFLGVIFGIYKHYDQAKILAAGRDAYLAAQSRWFDRVAAGHSAVHMLIAGVILAAVAVGLYEVIAAWFTRLLPPSTVEE